MSNKCIVLFLLPLLLICSHGYPDEKELVYPYIVDDTFSVEKVLPQISSISAFQVHPECQRYVTVDGVLYTKDLRKIVAYPAAKIGTRYRIESTVTSIGAYAFAYSKLELIDFPNLSKCNVVKIDSYAFAYCSQLRQIFIPATVRSIGQDVLIGCCTKTIIIAEEGSVAYRCFHDLEDVSFVCINDQYDVNEWIQKSRNLFVYPKELEGHEELWISDGALYQGDIMCAYPQKNTMKVYTIPEGVTAANVSILTNLFIETLIVPASCTVLSYQQCEESTFQRFCISEQNEAYRSVEGVLFSKDTGTLLSYPAGRIGDEYIVPATVETLYSDCFAYSNILKNLVLQNGVKEIGIFAFHASSIEKLTLPDSLCMIDLEAVEYCPNLKIINVVKGSYAEQFFYEIQDSVDLTNLLKSVDNGCGI